jgi:hypothetical protein
MCPLKPCFGEEPRHRFSEAFCPQLELHDIKRLLNDY